MLVRVCWIYTTFYNALWDTLRALYRVEPSTQHSALQNKMAYYYDFVHRECLGLKVSINLIITFLLIEYDYLTSSTTRSESE